MVTIKEVAKLAGVAVSTASNAINGKYGVKVETQRRVLEVAKQLNYIPNPMAQGLVTKSTRTISMIVSGPSSFNYFYNPVFHEVIKAITESLNEKKYRAQLHVINSEFESEEITRIAQSRISDGIILVDTRKIDDELRQLLSNVGIPSLVVIRGVSSENVSSVSVDHWQCSYIAIKYLIEIGHQAIGFIGNYPGIDIAEERLSAYKTALNEHGITYDESMVVYGDYYQESGLIGVRQLLRQASKLPTAIFAANDLMALGALEGLEQEGIRVPEDISLIGCDNIPNLHLLKVPLTTVACPFQKIGRLAAEKMIDVLEGKNEMSRQIVLGSELRIRKSVKSM